MTDLKNKTFSGIKWTTVGKFGRAGFQLLQIAVLTRFLDKEAFGLVAIALVVIGFTNIFVDMGLTSAILHKQDATQKEYSSIFWLNIIVSFLLFFLLIFSTPLVSEFYKEPELNIVIPLLGTNVLLIALGRQHRTILQKNFRFKSITVIELSSFFIGLLVAFVLALLGNGVYSLVFSTLAASLVSNVLFLLTNLKRNPISLRLSMKETIPFLKVGGYQTGSKIMDFFSQESDALIIGKILGVESLGIYTLAKQIVLKVFGLINPIVVTVLSPLFSSIQNESKKLKSVFLKVVRFLAYINFPIYLLIIASSKLILMVLYGSQYIEASTVLSFLAVYYCLISISNPVGSLQIATGRTDIGFYWTILRLLITPAVIFLGASYGLNGVAISMAGLSLLLLIPLWYMQLRPMAKISLREYLNQFYKPFVLFFVLIIALHFYNFSFGEKLIPLVAGCLFSLFLFFIFLIGIDRKAVLDFYNFIASILLKK